MKKGKNTIGILFVAVAILTSCSPMKVSYTGGPNTYIDSLVLVSTIIGKFQQPVLPLIDAAAFNGKTNSIADEIMDIQRKQVDSFRDIVAGSLKLNLGCEVIYGETLHNREGYVDLQNKYQFPEVLNISNDNFPKLITATDDINPFKFSNGKVIDYFKTSSNFKQTISDVCNTLNINYAAVSYSNLIVSGVAAFGINGYLKLYTQIYIFDKQGNLICDGRNYSPQSVIPGKNLQDYQNKLNEISFAINPLNMKLSSNFRINE